MKKNPCILVTNDDGINSQGIKILEKVAKNLSDNVYVIAPNTEQSAKSHSITLTEPLRINNLSKKRFSITGTPTDCVILGINQIIKSLPDLILSGINCGANIAEDISYSGTIAAAIEGSLMGVPSIALSQVYNDRKKISWDVSKKYSQLVINRLLDIGFEKNILFNINFPHILSKNEDFISITKQGKRGYEESHIVRKSDPRGEDYFWLGYRKQRLSPRDKSDLAAISNGLISVSPLKIDFTDNQSLKILRSYFK